MLAVKNSKPVRPEILNLPRYGWHDFTSFLKAYDEVTSVIATAADLEDVAYDYLKRAAGVGAIYLEFMLSPPDLIRSGVAFHDQLSALSSARDKALETHGIDCRLIATAVRHLGPEAALTAARIAVDRRHDILVGFGLTGDERQFEPGDFSEAFRIARAEGLFATAHAGEHRGPDSIIEAIELLGLSRVGHGVRAIESQSVLRQLSNERFPLEVCLTSNMALNLYPTLREHPISILHASGCVVTLGTDDPSFFDTDIAREYQTASDAIGSEALHRQATEWSIASAFCDDVTKKRLLLNWRKRTDDAGWKK